MEKKRLLYYEKAKLDVFKKQFSNDEDIVYPISILMNHNFNLKYTGIDGVEYFIIDITEMVLSALGRRDLRIVYESWINSLNEENGDRIDYCVEKTVLHEAYNLFHYYFDIDEADEEISDEIKEIDLALEKTTKEKKKSIVDYNKEQFDDLIERVETQLYGHSGFKEDLKKQLEAFILLYRMKRKKIFSMLLCGKSGIGKTEVGRILQREMYLGEMPIKINFGNYSGKGSLWSLIGSPKGYVGSEQGGELTNKIIHSNSKIIVIDELDKADEAIFTFFYEMLEDGQYTDLDGKLVDLDGYIVVFTANLDNTNFREMIPEPLFSRFDMTYEFKPLTCDEKEIFISEFISDLIEDYIKYVDDLDEKSIIEKIKDKNFQDYDNLRIIKRHIMNCFVDLVGEDSAWHENNREK